MQRPPWTIKALLSLGVLQSIYFPAGAVDADVLSKTLPQKNAIGTAEQKKETEKSSGPTEQPTFIFRTEGAVAAPSVEGESLKFKVPVNEKDLADDSMVDPVENQKSDEPFKTYIGYPKQQINFSYAPVYTSGKFNYNGSTFNFSSTSMTAASLSVKFLLNPKLSFEGEGRSYSASTKAGRPSSSVSVADSSIDIYEVFFRTNYCFIGTISLYLKLCPGLEIGMDSYPIIGFRNNTTLEAQKATEISYGINLAGEYPMMRAMMFKGRAGYIQGSGVGQLGELSSKKNIVLYANARGEWPVGSSGNLMNAGVNYQARSSTVEGSIGSNKDKWDTTLGSLTLQVGFTLEFNE